MKIVVIGGTGLIGAKLVERLQRLGHDAIPAAPSTGVDILTGAGLREVLAGAQVVVDLANSPTFDASAVAFFETAGRTLFDAERATGVRHHVALSVVGADRLPANDYLRAKLAQEALIKASSIPYSIVRSTQFFPFIAGIIQAGAEGGEVRLPSALIQPIDPNEVAAALAEVALGAPVNGTLEIAGPEALPISRFAEAYLRDRADPRTVTADAEALYFGSPLEERSLVPGPGARLGAVTPGDWMRQARS